MLSGCDADPASQTDRQGNSEVKSETETTVEEPERTIEPENEPTSSEDYTEGFGDTFSGITNSRKMPGRIPKRPGRKMRIKP